MIFSLAMSGTLEMRLATGGAMLHGGSESTDGEMVFETYREARDACKAFNERRRRGQFGQWIVVGVEATWSGSTGPFTKTACEFPKARALKRKAKLIPLNFVHGADNENKNESENGTSRVCEATVSENGGNGCVSSGSGVPVVAKTFPNQSDMYESDYRD